MRITAILAMTDDRLIGAKNGLPWHFPEDMKRFRDLTTGSVVIMGRNTYFSLPEKFRPLPNRRNIVLTSTPIDGIESFSDISTLIESLKQENIEQCFMIGGASVYDQFFEKDLIDSIALTLIHGSFDGDTFVREFRDRFTVAHEEDRQDYTFLTLNHL